MKLTTLAEAPEHWSQVLELFDQGWPRFMWRARSPRGADLHAAMRAHPSLQLLGLEGDVLIAMMQAVPADWTELPDDGWDNAVVNAPSTSADAPLHVGLAVTVAPDRRGEHLSARLLKASMAQAAGKRLVIPVRPNRKTDFPELTLQAYLDRTRDDGLSIDPWLRTHQRLGATIVGICHTSMRLQATAEQWDGWCGAPGPSGVHPGLLNAVGPDGIYVEPNVWVEHITDPIKDPGV